MTKKSFSPVKIVYLASIALLTFVFIAFVIEKSQLTDFYNKPINQPQASNTRAINDIQYTPADPTDNDTTNQQKADGTLDQIAQPSTSGSPISVILTAAGQDVVGGPVVVKVLLTDVNNGTCDVQMSKDGNIKNYSASVTNAGTYYTCDGFEVPFEDLELGSWKIKVTVTSNDRSGTAEQTIEVKA